MVTLKKEPFLLIHEEPNYSAFFQGLRMAWEVELALEGCAHKSFLLNTLPHWPVLQIVFRQKAIFSDPPNMVPFIGRFPDALICQE